MPAALSSRPVRFIALAVVIVWALFESYYHLGRPNISADEPVYINAGWQYVHGIFTFNREHPPTAKFVYGYAQELLGQGEYAGRLAASTISLIAGFAIFFWMRKELGWWFALVAAGFWWTLPRAVFRTGIKIDNFAILEPFMVSFAIIALALGWWWFRSGHWWLAVLSGAVMALSVTSKVSTAFLTVTFLYLAIRVVIRDRRWVRFIVSCVLYVVGFVAVFVYVYHPLGMRSAIHYMITFQSAHDKEGHGVIIMGKTVIHPPWWANLWFTEQGLGLVLTIALLVALVFAFVPKPSDLTLYISVASAVLLIFYCGVAKIALPSYYYVWTWAFFLLATIGIKNLWELRAKRRSRGRRSAEFAAPAGNGDGATTATAPARARWVTRPVAVVILVIALVSGVTTSAAIAAEHPTGFAVAESTLTAHHANGTAVLVTGYAPWEWSPYLGANAKPPVLHENGKYYYDGGPFAAIALRTTGNLGADPGVVAFVKANSSQLTHVVIDDVDLYIPTGGRQIVQVGRTLGFSS